MRSTRYALVALLALVPPVAAAAPDRVRDAALATYVHGMTPEIAEREAGRRAVPELLALLRDPEFPRRDNVVAFLAYLGGAEATPALRSLLDDPPAGLDIPEEARARALVPHALGRIAGRGDPGALAALLAMTAPDHPLRAEAVAALTLAGPGAASQAAEAQAALAPAVAYVPDPASRSHGHSISFANHVSLGNPMTVSRLDGVLAEATKRAATANYDGDVACCTEVVRGGGGATFGSSGDGLATIDTSAELNNVLAVNAGRVKIVTAINWCNGAGTNIIGCASTPGSSMILVRLSDLATEGILWIHEYGHNLGLDHSTDSRDLMYGTDNGSNRGMQPAHCAVFHAPPPGASASIFDAGTCTDDGDSIADPIDNCPFLPNDNQADGNGNGVGDVCEGCPGGADSDADGICNGEDNCPNASNTTQDDGDQDGVGDVCDNCPGTPNASQGNADGDALGDVCDACPADAINNPDGDGICTAVDNCPAVSNPSQADLDGDGFGDACETGAQLADVDLSGRVDGSDLARLGRAFGASSGDGRYDPSSDLDHDGQVDGADLSLLAAAFGQTPNSSALHASPSSEGGAM